MNNTTSVVTSVQKAEQSVGDYRGYTLVAVSARDLPFDGVDVATHLLEEELVALAFERRTGPDV